MTKGSHCSVIALMADHTLDLLVGVFGILKSGNGFVPIDPENPDERIKFIINKFIYFIFKKKGTYIT